MKSAMLSFMVVLIALALFHQSTSQPISGETVHMAEGQPVGTVVLDVGPLARSRLTVQQRTQHANLTLQLANGEPEKYFELADAKLRVARPIDREALCPSTSTSAVPCELSPSVVIRDVSGSQFLGSLTLRIAVLDLNDNAPTFTRNPNYLDVPESAAVGTSFRIQPATDRDAGTNAQILYSAVTPPADSPFKLDPNSKDANLLVTLERSLDREQRDRHCFLIRAEDRAAAPADRLTSTLTLVIRVVDVNDNSPVFEQPSYSANVREDAPLGSSVLRVRATDADGEPPRDSSPLACLQGAASASGVLTEDGASAVDELLGGVGVGGQQQRSSASASGSGLGAGSGSGVRLRYQLAQHVAPEVAQYFQVDESTGELSIRAPLDYDRGARDFTFAVVAYDSPFITMLTVTDADADDRQTLRCNTSEPSVFELALEMPNTYRVTTARPLDREAQAVHLLQITCVDRPNGSDALRDTAELRVVVEDVNDNAPRFERERFDVSVREEMPMLTELDAYPIRATDADAGNNSLVRYELEQPALAYFAINETTGVLRTRRVFDYEKKSDREPIEFRVFAKDGVHTSTATIVARVLDENDNSPLFKQPTYAVRIAENAASDRSLLDLRASDADSGENALLDYELSQLSDWRAPSPFRVDAEGQLRLKPGATLDREAVAQYTFEVVARDRGRPQRSATAAVTVTVTDENDCAPVFQWPLNSSELLNVSLYEPVNSVIWQLRATDCDEPITPNSQITFSLQDGGGFDRQYAIGGSLPHDYFAVDEKGAISVAQSLEQLGERNVTLRVEAQDKGVKPNRQKASFTVQILRNWHIVSRTGRLNDDEKRHRTEEYIRNVMIIVVMATLTLIATLVLVALLVCVKQSSRHSRRPARRVSSKARRGESFSHVSSRNSAPGEAGTKEELCTLGGGGGGVGGAGGPGDPGSLDQQPFPGQRSGYSPNCGSSENGSMMGPSIAPYANYPAPAPPGYYPLATFNVEPEPPVQIEAYRISAAASAAARPPSRAQQPLVPAHAVRPAGERAERQSLTSDSGRGGSMENCMAHSTVHMNVFNEYPGMMSMPAAYCATAYAPQQMPTSSLMPTYPAHFSPLVTRPMETVAVANLNLGAREMLRSISPNPSLCLNPYQSLNQSSSLTTAVVATPSAAAFGFRSLATATQPAVASPLTVSSSFPFPPPPPPLPPARNGASALDFSNSIPMQMQMHMGSLPRAGFAAVAGADGAELGADSSSKSSPNSGTASGTGSGSLPRPLPISGSGPALNQLSSLETVRALSNSPAVERRAAAAGAATGHKYSPSPIVTNTFI